MTERDLDRIESPSDVVIPAIYDRLLSVFGPRNWWPSKTPLETAVGAVLAQSVAWKSARIAVGTLEESGMLDIDRLIQAEAKEIARLIIPSRYYNQKADRLKNLAIHLHDKYGGDFDRMAAEDPDKVREGLLSVKGIGRETADSIMLYACGIPIFVVDAYTKRIFGRIGLIREDDDYETVRLFFTTHLPRSAPLFNDYHAQIVHLGNRICKKVPLCSDCPLASGEGWSGCRHHRAAQG